MLYSQGWVIHLNRVYLVSSLFCPQMILNSCKHLTFHIMHKPSNRVLHNEISMPIGHTELHIFMNYYPEIVYCFLYMMLEEGIWIAVI